MPDFVARLLSRVSARLRLTMWLCCSLAASALLLWSVFAAEADSGLEITYEVRLPVRVWLVLVLTAYWLIGLCDFLIIVRQTDELAGTETQQAASAHAALARELDVHAIRPPPGPYADIIAADLSASLHTAALTHTDNAKRIILAGRERAARVLLRRLWPLLAAVLLAQFGDAFTVHAMFTLLLLQPLVDSFDVGSA